MKKLGIVVLAIIACGLVTSALDMTLGINIKPGIPGIVHRVALMSGGAIIIRFVK